MTINTMKYFVDIVDNESFTKAAEKNNVAQTALSHSVNNLEKQLGLKLLIRGKGKGKVSLTSAGEVFYDYSKSMMILRDRTLKELAKMRDREDENQN